MMQWRAVVMVALIAAAVGLATPAAMGQRNRPAMLLSTKLQPFLSILTGRQAQFAAKGVITLHIDGRDQQINVQVRRIDDQTMVLRLDHEQYAAHLYRDATQTVLILPRHRKVFVGHVPIDGSDTLAPLAIIERLVSADSELYLPVQLLTRTHPQLAGPVLQQLGDFATDDEGITWRSGRIDGLSLRFKNDRALEVTAPGGAAAIELCAIDEVDAELVIPDEFAGVEVDRTEMERLLSRGVSRGIEVLAPGQSLLAPSRERLVTDYGSLRWEGEQRLVLLSGSPEQIGTAAGKLLRPQLIKCVDSVMYMVGLGWTLQSGEWFPDEMRSAWKRLEPFIPEHHKAEIDATAIAAGIDVETLRLANIFPELFHCSGFAIMNSATADGKLYHGRVLDYMTTIGLQDAAAVLVIAPQGRNRFVTVGYAGFVGSVTGMNERQISLGEMGGDGYGQWDGVPMATLMRRALEECSTLDEVTALWRREPRTCEYYYVFADGKIPDAVAVSATPEALEFVRPGESHARLGGGIPDAVVLSDGLRLEALRQRVTEQHGRIDAAAAIELMSHPVAMSSNLHNALFVPQDLLLYVARASHGQPAYQRPYQKFDIAALIDEAKSLGPLVPEETVGMRARRIWNSAAAGAREGAADLRDRAAELRDAAAEALGR